MGMKLVAGVTLFTLLASIPNAFGQSSGWVKQVSGTTAGLWGVSFTNADTGTVVGDYGTILHTTNGGVTWLKQSSRTQAALVAVSFPSADTGTVVGDAGTILRTSNGGGTWQKQESGTMAALESVCFPSTSTGFAVGDSGTVLRTTNGGTTWTSLDNPYSHPYYGIPTVFDGVSFVNDDTGTVVGGPSDSGFAAILHTTNGGATWIIQREGGGFDNGLKGVSFANANTGFAVGDPDEFPFGPVFKTTDGGTTWSGVEDGGNPFAVFAVDSNTATVVGDDILHTTNGGRAWVTQVSGTTASLLAVCFTDDTTGTAVGEGGTILRTTNGGFADVQSGAGSPITALRLRNYPNPLVSTTSIAYTLPSPAHVSLDVFNALGERVARLEDGEQSSGEHTMNFRAHGLVAGAYIVRLSTAHGALSTLLTILP